MWKSIAAIFFLALMITRLVFEIWFGIKCHGVKECHNRKCIHRLFCDSHWNQCILMAEDREELLAYLNEFIEDRKTADSSGKHLW